MDKWMFVCLVATSFRKYYIIYVLKFNKNSLSILKMYNSCPQRTPWHPGVCQYSCLLYKQLNFSLSLRLLAMSIPHRCLFHADVCSPTISVPQRCSLPHRCLFHTDVCSRPTPVPRRCLLHNDVRSTPMSVPHRYHVTAVSKTLVNF